MRASIGPRQPFDAGLLAFQLLVGLFVVDQVEHADGAHVDPSAGEAGLLHENQHIERVATMEG